MGKEPLEEWGLNKLYVHYLMSSYLYYQACVDSPWSDAQFDWACKKLLRLWDDFDHDHKYLTSKESLQAGTGFSISEYPTITKNCAMEWYDETQREKLNTGERKI